MLRGDDPRDARTAFAACLSPLVPGTIGTQPALAIPCRYPEELLQRFQRQQPQVGADVRPARNRTVRWDDFDSVEPEPAAAPTVGLKEGDEVSHEIFGHGVVISLRSIGRDAEVTFALPTPASSACWLRWRT